MILDHDTTWRDTLWALGFHRSFEVLKGGQRTMLLALVLQFDICELETFLTHVELQF